MPCPSKVIGYRITQSLIFTICFDKYLLFIFWNFGFRVFPLRRESLGNSHIVPACKERMNFRGRHPRRSVNLKE